MSNPSFIAFSESGIKFIDGDRGVNYPNKSELKSDGYCVFLNTGNVKKTGFDFSRIEYIDEEKDSKLRKGKIEKGDIVLTTRGTVGNVAIVDDGTPYSNIRINSGMVIVRANPKEYDPYFILLFFRSALFEKQYLSHGSGSAQPQLPISALKNICFPDFDIETQRAIVKTAICIDKKIVLNNRINAELEAMAKTLYDYWFVQFDFPDDSPQGQGKPYKASGRKMVYNPTLKRKIPEGWEVKKLSEIAVTGSGGTPLSSNPAFYENATIPWINSGELNAQFIVSTPNFITELGLEKSSAKLFSKNTILMAMYGATAGKVSFIDFPAATNQAICAINPSNQEMNVYLKFTLERLYKYLINLSSGSARDNLSQDKIKSLDVVIPEQSTLAQFHEFTKSKMDLILTNLKENQELTSLRDWLIPMLMNGQVTVK